MNKSMIKNFGVVVALLMGAFFLNAQEYKVITDHMGRTIKLPVNPQRIISFYPLLMDGLYTLGYKPIAKVDEYKIRKEGMGLPTVGSQLNVNIESVHKMEPDLIFASTRAHSQIVSSLEETGACVYMFDPAKFNASNSLFGSLIFLGELLDKKEIAETHINEISKKAEKLKTEIQQKTKLKKAIVIQDSATLTAAQTATAYGSIIKILGLTNIVPDNIPGSSKETFIPVDVESIIKSNPDLVLIIAATNDPEQNKKSVESFVKNPNWKKIAAVKNKNVKVLPFKVNPGRATAEEMISITAKTILGSDS